jgi:hypothetical protein
LRTILHNWFTIPRLSRFLIQNGERFSSKTDLCQIHADIFGFSLISLRSNYNFFSCVAASGQMSDWVNLNPNKQLCEPANTLNPNSGMWCIYNKWTVRKHIVEGMPHLECVREEKSCVFSEMSSMAILVPILF